MEATLNYTEFHFFFFWQKFLIASPLNILFYRYYYKQNIFGIVENKRLVYRFGSKAKDWKPVGKTLKTNAVSPPERRCYNCLRLLESGSALKVQPIHETSKIQIKLFSCLCRIIDMKLITCFLFLFFFFDLKII